MIEEIQEDIIGQLKTIAGVATVDAWQGEIDDLIKMPKRLPSLHVIYQAGEYEPFEQVGEDTAMAMSYLIVLMASNQKSRAAGSITAYRLIEAVREKLKGHWVGTYDFLRPTREDLITTRGGLLVYGLGYELSNILVQTS